MSQLVNFYFLRIYLFRHSGFRPEIYHKYKKIEAWIPDQVRDDIKGNHRFFYYDTASKPGYDEVEMIFSSDPPNK